MISRYAPWIDLLHKSLICIDSRYTLKRSICALHSIYSAIGLDTIPLNSKLSSEKILIEGLPLWFKRGRKNSRFFVLTNRRQTTAGTTHHHCHGQWSPSLSAKADRDDRLRTTSTLLGGTHRCVPYCVIVFSFTFSTLNLIYNQRVAFRNLPLATCNLPLV